MKTENDEVTLTEVIEFARVEWKWLLLGALLGLLFSGIILLMSPKRNTSTTLVQLSDDKIAASVLASFKDIRTLPPKINNDCGVWTSSRSLAKNHILIKPAPNKINTLSIEAQIYLPLDSKQCIRSVVDFIYSENQSAIKQRLTPLESQININKKHILEINRFITQSDRDTNSNGLLIKSILLEPLLKYQDQVLSAQTSIETIKSKPFTIGSIEDQTQPFSKVVVILVFSALAGLAIGAGIRWAIRHFSR